MSPAYDVYLCYNNHDRETVLLIREALEQQGVRCYGQDEHPGPKQSWEAEFAEVLQHCRVAAIFFGANGLSPWENLVTRLLLTRAVLEGVPLMPVLLPNAPQELALPRFLSEFTVIRFGGGITDIDSLVQSIPGRKKNARRAKGRNNKGPTKVETTRSVQRILFLGACPEDQQHLRLDHEVRQIDRALRAADFRESFDLRQQLAVRPSDLQEALLRYQPQIVHFSGHGQTDGILLENDAGQAHKVQGRVLARIFREFKSQVRCVVLNACYSEDQATAIAEDIDFVVGMSASIDDLSAIQFASAFYEALAFGTSISKAFNLACAQIDLAGLEEGNLPRLIALRQNPDETKFAGA